MAPTAEPPCPGIARGTLIIVLLLLHAISCGPTGQSASVENAPPVVVVALDGLSWQVAAPLMDEDGMPALTALVRDGAAGQLETIRPTWTPVIFTTMATGQPPERHGVNTFVSEEGIPLTSNVRRVPALWNILGDRGLPTLFFGWPVTWPAEPVTGEMISDRWHKSGERQVFPAELADVVAPRLETFRNAGVAVPAGLERLAGLASPDRVSRWLHGSFEGPGDTTAERTVQPDRLVGLTRKKVETGFLWNVALDSDVKLPLFLQRLRAVRPRLSAVYFNATDMAQHFFGGADRLGERCLPERNLSGREAIDETYRVYDRLLGRLVAGVRGVEGYEDAVFVVLSDHGIDLASPRRVRWNPPAGDSTKARRIIQRLLAEGVVETVETGSRPVDQGWQVIRFPDGGPMSVRSRALNLLDQAGCTFHPDDTFIYFVHDEAPPGVVVISGGTVRPGRRLEDMSVNDVAPTLLALLGLPAARDMCGAPAPLELSAGSGGPERTLSPKWIDSYGTTLPAGNGEAISSPEDAEIRGELRALGYIE